MPSISGKDKWTHCTEQCSGLIQRRIDPASLACKQCNPPNNRSDPIYFKSKPSTGFELQLAIACTNSSKKFTVFCDNSHKQLLKTVKTTWFEHHLNYDFVQNEQVDPSWFFYMFLAFRSFVATWKLGTPLYTNKDFHTLWHSLWFSSCSSIVDQPFSHLVKTINVHSMAFTDFLVIKRKKT